MFRIAIGGHLVPHIPGSIKEYNQKKQAAQDHSGRDPFWRCRKGLFRLRGGGRQLLGAHKVVFAQKGLFGQAEITRNAANKAMAEDAARQFSPVFVFQGLEKPIADPRSLAKLVQGDFPELPLALQMFAEFSPGHGKDLSR